MLKNLAETSPEKLEAAMEGFPASVRLQAETALSLGRLKESFQREIRQLWERPDGWMIFQSNASSIEGIGEKFLGELANLPLSWRRGLASSPYQFVRSENARMWWDADLESAGFSAREILRIRSRALTTIGQTDPADAIRRMGELEMDDSQRKSMLSNLFGNMRDLDKARELLSQLGSDEDRAIANQMLDSRNSREDTESKPENATDWLAKAAGADPKQGGMDSYRMFSALRNWDAEKMAALTAGFRGLEPEKKMVVARMIASHIGNYGEASEQLAGDALVHLMENPAPKVDGQGQRDSLMSIAGAHVVRLSTRDPAAAVEWVNSLPAGETKTWTQRNLLGNWKQYDPKAAGAWEKSLPAADRAALDKLNKK
ncbi:MAG: hypothetical protein EOP87_15535 [Verrucomicrobiaceae bacterium]|nr:MAG: hypothetical protein EOP87_15535 [Verrucomicrobiaceae bacterium]